MKRLLSALLFLLLVYTPGLAAYSRVAIVSGDEAAVDRGVVLTAVVIATDGVNDCTVTLYDHKTQPTGIVLTAPLKVAGLDNYGGTLLPTVEARNGVYADLTTSGTCTVAVYYTEKQ